MLLRVQFAGETFAKILRRGFARQDLCGAAVLATTPPGLAYIDHIEVGEQPALPYEVGPTTTTVLAGATLAHPTLYFVQEIRLAITTLVDLRKAVNGVPLTHAIDIKPVFRLALEVRYGERCLTITYVGLRAFPEPRPYVKPRLALIEPELANLAALLGQPLDDTKLESMLGSALAEPVSQPLSFLGELGVLELPPVAHMGLAASPGFGSVEMRFDLRAGGQQGIDVGAWNAFHNQNGVDDIRAGADWALLIDKDVLLQRGRRLFADGIADAEKKGRFKKNAEPSASWSAVPPGLHLACSGLALDALDCFGEDIHVPVDIKVDAGLGITQKDIGGHLRTVLRADVQASHEAHPELIPALCHAVFHSFELDNVLDFIGGVFDGSVIGDFVDWLDGTKPVFPIGVAVMFGPIGFLFLCVVDVVAFALEGDDSKTLEKELAGCEIPDPNNPDSQVCYIQIGVDPGPTAYYGLTLDQARGRPDGLVLAGKVSIGGAKRPEITVSSSALQWIPPRKACDGPIFWTGRATIRIKQTVGDWPVRVCPVRPDLFPAFALPAGKDYTKFVRTSVVVDSPREVELEIAIPPYEADPAAGCCRLFVVTSAGVRSVWIPFPPLPDAETLRQGEFWVQAWRVAYCETLVDDWTRYFQRYNPKWSVDPPPDANQLEKRLWVVIGERFRAADRVLVYEGERRIVEAFAGRDGRLSFGVFAAGDAVVFERRPERPASADAGVLYRAGGTASFATHTRQAGLEREEGEPLRDDRRPALTVHQLQLLEYARVPAALDAARVDVDVTANGVRFIVQATSGASSVEVDGHGVVAVRRLRQQPARERSTELTPARRGELFDARSALLGVSSSSIEILRDECREFRTIGRSTVELSASYVGVPWSYRSAQAGEWFAQLDDATGTLGIFRFAGRVSFPIRETHRVEG